MDSEPPPNAKVGRSEADDEMPRVGRHEDEDEEEEEEEDDDDEEDDDAESSGA